MKPSGQSASQVRAGASAMTERITRADGWYSRDGGLSWMHPAPNAAQPAVADGHTVTFTSIAPLVLSFNQQQDRDAARYRWLRDWGSSTWTPFRLLWGMPPERCDAAIDEEMARAAAPIGHVSEPDDEGEGA